MSAEDPTGYAAASSRVASSVGGVWTWAKSLVAFLLLWELVAQSGQIPEQALPHTYDVARAFGELAGGGQLLEEAALTVSRAMGAFTLAIVVGVTVGLLMSQFRGVEWFFDPIISIGFPIPKVTLVPIYVLWFGFGTLPITLLAATSAFFPVAIGTYEGTRGVDRELVWSARSMGLSRLQTARKVVLPASLPDVFNGIQISLFLSFVVVIVAEMVISGGGLGELLVRAVRFFRTPDAFVALITAAVLGLVFDRLFRRVRGYLLRWTE